VSARVVPVPLGPFDLYLHASAGKGGMATVWSARHRVTGTPVAVKVLDRVQAQDEIFLAAFASEVRAVAGLEHPSVVHVLDHGLVPALADSRSNGALPEGSPFLVMEYASAGTLLSVPPPDGDGLIAVLRSVLEALAHAHARGVVHRDIKAGNVLLCGADDLRPGWKLSDFGLAVGLGDDPEASAFGDGVVGTPSYMAPEQFRGDVRDIGPWTDLYSTGCLGWRVATGRTPFGGGDSRRLRRAHATRPLPPFVPAMDVPEGFEAWLRRLLRKAPRDRFVCAADALRALDRVGGAVREGAGLRGDDPDEETTIQMDPQAVPSPTVEGITGGAPTHIPDAPGDGIHPVAPSLLGAGLGLLRVRRLPLVGRARQRAALWSALRRVFRERRPGVALVHGERGRGKTRLVSWLTEQAAELGVAHVFWVRHGPTGSLADGFAGSLMRTFGLSGLSIAEQRVRVKARLAHQGVTDPRETAAILSLVTDPTGPDPGPTPDERRAVFRRFLGREASDRPVVLAVDDLHRGEAVLELGRDLARDSRRELPVLVVGVCTTEALRAPDLVGKALRALLAAGSTAVEVEPLSEVDVDRLLASLLGLSSALAANVSARAEGNPLFAVQMVGDLADRGVLVAGPVGFEPAEGASVALPANIHALWQARLERLCAGLGAGVRGALEIAAVLGERVVRDEWHRACAIADVSPIGLEAALLDAGLAHAQERGWSFAHGLLRESIVATAESDGGLARRHLACAEMLAQRPGLPSGIDLQRRGDHLMRAEAWEDAIPPLLAAAERLWKGDASRSAQRTLDWVDEALDKLRAPLGDVRVLRAMAVRALVCIEIGEITLGQSLALGVPGRARQVGAPLIEGQALLMLGRIHLRGYRAEAAIGGLEEAVILLAGADASTRAEVHRIHARALAHLDRHDDAVAGAQRALDIAEEAGNDSDAGRALAVFAFIHRHRGDHAQAEETVLLANERYERAGHHALLADGYASLGESHRASGRLDSGLQWFRRAEEVWARTGNRHELMAILCAAGVLIEMKRYAEALSQIERARARLDPEPGYLKGAAAIIELEARSELGEWPIVAVVLDELLRLEGHNVLANPEYLTVLRRAGELAMGQGNLSDLLLGLAERLHLAGAR
jgi:tetratricopeptide (TPR) repeat protein